MKNRLLLTSALGVLAFAINAFADDLIIDEIPQATNYGNDPHPYIMKPDNGKAT